MQQPLQYYMHQRSSLITRKTAKSDIILISPFGVVIPIVFSNLYPKLNHLLVHVVLCVVVVTMWQCGSGSFNPLAINGR
jgi:hypothetical protein